jgi:hypothetical protein
MVEYGQGPRSGARDNGLRCAGYAPVGDLDPRVADALLESLRTEGIAAYVTPTPAERGGALEVTVPSGLTDRLYADSEHAARAWELLAATPQTDPARSPAQAPAQQVAQPESEIDFESAWQQLLGSLQSGSSTASPQWPASESLNTVTQVPVGLPANLPIGVDPAMDEHFVPPPPPPLPRLRRVTVIALLSILAGLVVLATNFDGGSLVWLAVLAIFAGGATLIYHVKEGPPTDSGWDDGAVV